MNKRSLKPLFFVIFTLSGFSGIIYESIWTHYLKLFLGHAAYAQTLVLAIFMGGMAIGSCICSLYSTRWTNLYKCYALMEGLIGIAAILFHSVFDEFINFSFTTVIPSISSPQLVHFYKWTFSSLLILPQSVMLGMTFPLMSAAIIRSYPEKPGGTISMLYFTNSIGAAIGVLASGFVLIRLSGLPGTIQTAGVINIALALVVWSLADKQAVSTFNVEAEEKNGDKGASRFYLFLMISFFTGLASFIYEIGWLRMLSLVLGSSTHAFELMLSAFILGLAFGGLWIRRRIDRIKRPERFLGIVQLVMGMLALATLPLYGNTFSVMEWILETVSRTETGYIQFNLLSHTIALAIMVPATFCAGMTLPLTTHILIRQGHGEKSIGSVYTANTVGAILGIFYAVHLGMPVLGLKNLIISGAAVDILLGLFILWVICSHRSKKVPFLLSAASVVVLLIISFGARLDPYKMASGVYRETEILDSKNTKVLYSKDGKTATVNLTASNGVYSIRTNGKVDAAVSMKPGIPPRGDEYTVVMAAVIPLLLNPDAKNAVNIGIGSGITSHVLLSAPFLEAVDTVEIEEAMVEGAKAFRPRNELVFSDPRSHIHFDDAKTFFSTYNKKYDIIISEPSNPWVSGVSSLFSEEFYSTIKRHLSDNGILVQWVQLYEIDLNLVASIIKALSSQFPYYEIYAPNYGDILIVAPKRGHLPALEREILNFPAIANELKRVGINTINDVEIRKIGDRDMLKPLINSYSIRANSDYYPVLDLNAAKTRFLRSNALELTSLAKESIPVLEMLDFEKFRRSGSNVSPSPYFKKTSYVIDALQIKNFLLGNVKQLNLGAGSMYLEKDVINVKRFLGNCKEEEINISSIFNTFVRIAAYLTPLDMHPIWELTDINGCYSKVSGLEKDWILFFKSVAERDATMMEKQSRKILESDTKLTSPHLEYLVASSMLANLALERREDSLSIWSEYRHKIFGKNQPSFLFHLLEILSNKTN